MKITKRQLRRLIREHQGTLNEGVWEYVTDYIDPSGIFSGAGAGIDEDELKSIASPDAWILFKALGGLGTDEDAVKEVLIQLRTREDYEQLMIEYQNIDKQDLNERLTNLDLLGFLITTIGVYIATRD